MHTLKTFVVHFPPHIASRILLVCDCFLSSETLERSRTHLSGLVNRSLQGLKKNPLRHLILKRCLWPRCRPGVEQRALQSWNFNVHVSRHKHFDWQDLWQAKQGQMFWFLLHFVASCGTLWHFVATATPCRAFFGQVSKQERVVLSITIALNSQGFGPNGDVLAG